MDAATSHEYVLGHDTAELERLNHAGKVLAPATRLLLQAAGLRQGMRVLDLGSGAGDVAFLAAEMVAPDGEVHGIDQARDAVATAQARARYAQLDNVDFSVGDIHEASSEGSFDAIVGRLVLMHVADPVAVLRTQATKLRPGGVVAPIEYDLSTARSIPPTMLISQSLAWLVEAFERAGVSTSLGPRLWTILGDAGLQPRGMLGVQPHFGPDDPAGSAMLAGVMRSMLPIIERTGVATAEQVNIATLRERLAQELSTNAAVLVHPTLFCAWGAVKSE